VDTRTRIFALVALPLQRIGRCHRPSHPSHVQSMDRCFFIPMQACENEIRGAKTHLEDETKRFEMAKRDLEEERSNHATDVSRGPLASLASLPESARDALGSIASNLETVLEECVICSELLLDGIGTPSFGLMSYSCGCSRGGHVRTLHVNCVVSMSNLNCPQCSDEIVLIAPSLMAPTAFRKFTVRKSWEFAGGENSWECCKFTSTSHTLARWVTLFGCFAVAF